MHLSLNLSIMILENIYRILPITTFENLETVNIIQYTPKTTSNYIHNCYLFGNIFIASSTDFHEAIFHKRISCTFIITPHNLYVTFFLLTHILFIQTILFLVGAICKNICIYMYIYCLCVYIYIYIQLHCLTN